MNLFFVGLFSTLVFLSCSNLDEPGSQPSDNSNVSILGKSVAVENGMLSFENKESLNSLLAELEKSEPDEALKINTFRSMFDVYDEALEEAPKYYETKEGYEEFKEKYASLYFPEYGNDYAAYLPISDKKLAKLANDEGNIIIGGETINYKDINSYEDLAALGWADPDEAVTSISTRASKEIFYRKSGDNKLWINVSNSANHVFEVCFRDKGFLGAWYNRKASTKIKVGKGIYHIMTGQVSTYHNIYSGETNDKFSSHDYKYMYIDAKNPEQRLGYISFGPWGLNNFYLFRF